MFLDYKALSKLLMKEPVLTYCMRQHLFHSPIGTDVKLWYQDDAAVLLKDWLHLYGDEKGLDKILGQLESGQKYSFFCVPSRYQALLESHFTDIKSEEDCSAYTISVKDLPIGEYEVQDSLTLDDAEFVNSHWTYTSEGTLDFFKRVIVNYPSSAIRIDGKLVAWAVCYDATDDMANLGSLRVLDEYRKQGLGKKISMDLIMKVLKWGKTPMVHIVEDNTASKTLSMGIGFKPHPEKIFWGSGIKK